MAGYSYEFLFFGSKFYRRKDSWIIKLIRVFPYKYNRKDIEMKINVNAAVKYDVITMSKLY